jgi:penicillin-binding protein 1A
MPGSSFKPLYYSAAIDTRKFHPRHPHLRFPGSLLQRERNALHTAQLQGRVEGPVLLWYALAHSMNVPSLKVLDGNRVRRGHRSGRPAVGHRQPRNHQEHFSQGISARPGSGLRHAHADGPGYAVFANQGKEVTPIAIRSVEDGTDG